MIENAWIDTAFPATIVSDAYSVRKAVQRVKF